MHFLRCVKVEWWKDVSAHLRLISSALSVDLHQGKSFILNPLHRIRHLVARLASLDAYAVISFMDVLWRKQGFVRSALIGGHCNCKSLVLLLINLFCLFDGSLFRT